MGIDYLQRRKKAVLACCSGHQESPRERKEREPPHKHSCCRLLGGYAPSLLFLLHRLPNFFREWIRDSQKLHYFFLEVIGIDFTKCILAVKSFMSGRFKLVFNYLLLAVHDQYS